LPRIPAVYRNPRPIASTHQDFFRTLLGDVAAYDPGPGAWETLEASRGTSAYPAQSRRFVAGDPTFVLVGESLGMDLGDLRVHFLSGDG
jgi:hypothetical protein